MKTNDNMENELDYIENDQEEQQFEDSDSDSDTDMKKDLDDELEQSLMGYENGKNPQMVEFLTTLALKQLMKSLLMVITQNIQTYDRKKSTYNNPRNCKSKEINEIVAYYKSHREFLTSTKLIETYNELIKNLFSTVDIGEIGVMEYLFWLCFENTDSKEIKFGQEFDDTYNDSAEFKMNFIKESESDFPLCSKMFLVFDEHYDHLEGIENLFDTGKFPNLKDLKVKLCSMANSCDFIASFLPKLLKKLKKLDLIFVKDVDVGDYYRKIKKMKENQNIEFDSVQHISFNIRNYFWIGGPEQLFEDDPEHWYWSSPKEEEAGLVDYLLESLMVFKNLQEFRLVGLEDYEMRSTDLPNIESENKNMIQSVKSATFESAPIHLVKINNTFMNLETLTLFDCQFPEEHLEEIQSLPSLNTVKHLSIDYRPKVCSEDYQSRKLRMSKWLKLFPNLEEFELRTIEQEDSLPDEIKSLKVLKILDKLKNPKILSKFPNLNRFVQEWPKDNFLDEFRKVKSYIPQFEKGSEEVIIQSSKMK